MVARMREAGAIIIGMTVMTEWGVTPLGWSVHAQGPTNPFNTNHLSGGSSSGSAVAVALGLVPMAIGFDGGGSIRIPAALSGVYGLAATYGRITFHTDPIASMIHAGPLAATLTDAALSYAWLASSSKSGGAVTHTTSDGYGGDGPPPAHLDGWTPSERDEEKGIKARKDDLKGVRLGIFRDHFNDASKEVVDMADAAVEKLERRGATIVEIAIPNLHALQLSHGITISSEFSWAHDRETTNGWPIEPSTAIQLAIGRSLTAVEVHAANRLRSWGMEMINKLFESERLDAIVTPTVARTAPVLTSGMRASGASDTALVVELMKHIFLANLLGLPALSVPLGLGAETSLPIGLQLIGSWWEEGKLLRLAKALDADGSTPRPKLFHDDLDGLMVGGWMSVPEGCRGDD